MSRILKRPMFRIGGPANDGIMSMAAPRRNYQNGTEYEKQLQETLPFLERVAGPGPSVRSDLSDLLISGGLNLLSGKGAGKGTLGALAESYKEPYAAFDQARDQEDAFKRQLGLSAATGAIGSVDAERAAAQDRAFQLQVASIKEKIEKKYLSPEHPDDVYNKALKAYLERSKKESPFDEDPALTFENIYAYELADFTAYKQPKILNSTEFRKGLPYMGPVPNQIIFREGKYEVQFNFEEMLPGGVYFDPRSKSLRQLDPNTNMVYDIDEDTGRRIDGSGKSLKGSNYIKPGEEDFPALPNE